MEGRPVVEMTVGGRSLDLTAEEVVARMHGQEPEPIREHVVEVLTAAFPPKQVLATATGWDRNTFTTMEAVRVLSRLGFACRRAGTPPGKQPPLIPDTPEGGPLSIDQRLKATESGLAVAQEAIASLARRIAALEEAAGGPSPARPDALLNSNDSQQQETRDGGDMTAGTQNWRLIEAAARALTAAGRSPFSRIAVYRWIWSRHPRADHDRPTLDPTFQGMIENAPGGPPSSGGTPLRRVARGLYVLGDEGSGS
jgi:hypothetical protein